ncbi:hypothetical protein T484DRAFT_1751433 [Baffinella frigidus]|nr:hypothetical protein T484DRAFT_1751433 [Cryptophyta sp. CCMP2293]
MASWGSGPGIISQWGECSWPLAHDGVPSVDQLGIVSRRWYNSAGVPENMLQTLTPATEPGNPRQPRLYNGRPVWELDTLHSFRFTPFTHSSGLLGDGYWALIADGSASAFPGPSRLGKYGDATRRAKHGDTSCFCPYRPSEKETPGSLYPPLGVWIRGRPWEPPPQHSDILRTMPQFSLERVGGAQYGA